MDHSKFFEHLCSQNWKVIIPKLVLYATLIIKAFRKKTPKMDPEDLAFDAIKQLFTKERNWDPGKVEDVFVFLKNVVRGQISNQATSSEFRRKKSLVSETVMAENENYLIEEAPSPEHGAQEYLEKEDLENYLLHWAEDDKSAQAVLDCLFMGMKRREVIEETALPPNKVDNLMKRIRRALKKFLA